MEKIPTPSRKSYPKDSSSAIIPEAYVTLVTSEGYVVGALVLAHSLRLTGTQRPIICLVSRTAQLSSGALAFLAEVFHQVRCLLNLYIHNIMYRCDMSMAWTLEMPHTWPSLVAQS